jgi:sugar lactone lactonase YvrE
MRYRHARTMAGRGNGADRFRAALRGIAIDAQDRLYAAGDTEVKVFEADGALRRRWAVASQPFAVAVATDGRVFAGESRQIEIFDRDGRLLDTWRDAERLGRVSALGFTGPDVLAADSHGRAIRRYDASGRFRNDIGLDTRTRGFAIPNGVLDFGVDALGTIHAANPGKHRIERYTPDGARLGHIGRFSGPDPSGFSGCCNPTNVCVAGGTPSSSPGRARPDAPARAGSRGSGSTLIYVTEKAGPRVKVYDGDGVLLSIVADQGFDPNCKNMDLAVDSRGAVYVVDTVRLEIRVFEREAAA